MKISIVTPSFNQGQFLESAILSVLGQDYPDLEYIVIDGGSTDSSLDVIRKYADRLSCWASEPDEGQSHAINKGWSMATGDIVAWINADDIYCPGAFSRVANAFEDNPDAVMVIGSGSSYDITLSRQLLHKPPELDPRRMIETCGGGPIQPAVFLRKKVFEEVGPLRQDLHYILDWEYWIRVGLYYPPDRIAMIDSTLAINREWPRTKTNTGAASICREHRQVLDMLFATHRSDAGIQSVKQAAYRSSYRKEAELARADGETIQALRHALKALAIGPFSHNPARELVIILYVILGRNLSGKIREVLAPVRDKLNRITGY